MRVAGASRERPADPVQHHGPAAEGSAALAADAGRAHLGARVAHGARRRAGDRRDPLAAAAVETEHDVLVEQTQRGAEGGQQDRGGPRIPRRRGVEPVVAEHLVRALLELGAEDVAQRHRAPAGGDDRHGLGGGEVAAPPPRERPERLGDRLQRPEVGAGADDDLGAGVAQPADRGLEVTHGDRLVDAVGDVVGADEDHRGVRLRHDVEGVGHLDAQVAGHRAHDGDVGEADPTAREGGDPGREDGPDGLPADLGTQAGRAAVAEDQQLERSSRCGAVDTVVLGGGLLDDADRHARQQRLGLDQAVADDAQHADAGDPETAPVGSGLGDPARAPCTSHRIPHPVLHCPRS